MRAESIWAAPLRILLVEDEQKVAKALQEGLEAESYSVAVAHRGDEGLLRVSSEPFDLAVLDVMLPGRSGIEVLSAMRSQGIIIPVLLLTAKDTISDRVLGLDAGADDYLVKPFAFPGALRTHSGPFASRKTRVHVGAATR